jgi:hypothetical protein
MVSDNILREEYEELKQKHNDLCEILDNMKLNPLADFDSCKVDEYIDEENYEKIEEIEEIEENNENNSEKIDLPL